MPFFIQLSVQELIDLFDQKGTTISNAVVDLAFEQICNRRNNIHFDSYYNRLKDTFSQEDYELALKILNLISEKNEISKIDLLKALKLENKEKDFNPIIESLEYDGYTNLRDGIFTFNSPILRLWWNKYIKG